MKEKTYKTLGIYPSTHQRLKSLAGAKRVSMATYLEQVVAFFHRSGADPEELLQNGENRSIQAIRKQVDFLVKMIKQQESKLLKPLAQSVFELEYRLSDPMMEMKLSCPICQAAYKTFKQTAEYLHCEACTFKLPLEVGQPLEKADIICLLSGGITRHFDTLITSNGQTWKGRLYLHPEKNYSIAIYQSNL